MNNSSFLSCISDYEDCADSSVDSGRCTLPNLAPLVPAAIDYLQAVVTMAIMKGSVAMNVATISFIWKYRKTERRTFLLSLLLVLFNLQYTFLVLPFVCISSVAREWIFGEGVCLLVGSLRDFFFAGHFMSLTSLAFDHFLTIFAPYFYARHGNKMAMGMILAPFFVGMNRFIAYTSYNCITYVHTRKVCSVTGGCGATCAVLAHLMLHIGTMSGIVIPIILYTIVYVRLRQRDKKAVLSEGNHKEVINKKILGTFVWLVSALVGLCLLGLMVSFVYYLSSPVAPGSYFVLTIVSQILTSCITIINAAVVFHSLYVREALRENYQTMSELPSASSP